jgi:hypothetical protein
MRWRGPVGPELAAAAHHDSAEVVPAADCTAAGLEPTTRGGPGSGWWAPRWDWWEEPVDASSLSALRIMWGMLHFLEAASYIANDCNKVSACACAVVCGCACAV